jgi:hypothetical protein
VGSDDLEKNVDKKPICVRNVLRGIRPSGENLVAGWNRTLCAWSTPTDGGLRLGRYRTVARELPSLHAINPEVTPLGTDDCFPPRVRSLSGSGRVTTSLGIDQHPSVPRCTSFGLINTATRKVPFPRRATKPAGKNESHGEYALPHPAVAVTQITLERESQPRDPANGSRAPNG